MILLLSRTSRSMSDTLGYNYILSIACASSTSLVNNISDMVFDLADGEVLNFQCHLVGL